MAIQYVSVASKTRVHFLLLSGSRWTLRRQAICGRAAAGFDSAKARDLTREQILLEYGNSSRGGGLPKLHSPSQQHAEVRRPTAPLSTSKPRRNMRRSLWTARAVALVRELYPHRRTAEIARQLECTTERIYSLAGRLGLRKTAEYLASPDACRLRRRDDGGVHAGARTCYKKGHVPANKGLRRPGWGPGRMKETQFRKGERRGRANAVYKPIGTERISKDGYLERKVNDDLPLQARWRAVHRIDWEAKNGRVPRGFALCFVNGDKTDRRLENLTLISRADLCRRNSIHNLPPAIKGAITVLGQLKRRIREKQDRRSA